MVRGTIASLRSRQGFGFIVPENRRLNIFFHRDAVEGGQFDQLRVGQPVEFEESADPIDPKRTRANFVRPGTP